MIQSEKLSTCMIIDKHLSNSYTEQVNTSVLVSTKEFTNLNVLKYIPIVYN